MSYRRKDKRFEDICSLAVVRKHCAYRCVVALLPDADDRKPVKIARKILTLCDGKDRSTKITPAQTRDLVLSQTRCLSRECPMCLFDEPLKRHGSMETPIPRSLYHNVHAKDR